MKLPKGITTTEGDRNSQISKLEKDIHGVKTSGRVWYNYLIGGLITVGFEQFTNN